MGLKSKKLLLFSFATIGVTLPPIPFCSSCQQTRTFSIDGSDWQGVVSGGFTDKNYTINEEAHTITYHGDPESGGSKIVCKNLVIPNYVFYNEKMYCVLLGDYCFQGDEIGNSSIIYESVELNDFIDEIPTSCFTNQINLTDLRFHIHPKKIGDKAFMNCRLHNIYVNGSTSWTINLIFVGSYAFYECRLGGSLVFGKNIEQIGSYSFYGNFNIEFIDLSFATKINEIPPFAFTNLILLKKVNVHKGLTKFGASCFQGCTLLQTIELPVIGMSLTIGPFAFAYCTGFLKFSLKCKFESIGEYSFIEDKYLDQNIWDPEYGLKTIPSNAFNGLSQSTITLSSDGPTEIKDNAFADCYQLTTIDLRSFVWPSFPKWSGVNIFVNANVSRERNGFILFDKSQLDSDGNIRPWIKNFFYDYDTMSWTRQGIIISDTNWVFQFI